MNPVGWFPAENQEVLDALIRKHKVETVLEIGAFVGLSTVFFAGRVELVNTVDPFDALTRVDYLHGVYKEQALEQLENFRRNTEAYKNITAFACTSEQAAERPELLPEYDLIYIDGSHEYSDVKKDIELWYPRAAKVLCGDDYTRYWPGVMQAVDECGHAVNKTSRCWYIEK